MKAWQLTTGLAVLAIAAGQLDPAHFATVSVPHGCVRSSTAASGPPRGGFEGPERHEPSNGRHKVRLKPIDEWIRDSQSIRTCFFGVSQTLGYLPDAEVRIHVTESGRVADSLVMDPGVLQLTDLDACLSRAFRELIVPTYDGAPPLSVRYPFKF